MVLNNCCCDMVIVVTGVVIVIFGLLVDVKTVKADCHQEWDAARSMTTTGWITRTISTPCSQL